MTAGRAGLEVSCRSGPAFILLANHFCHTLHQQHYFSDENQTIIKLKLMSEIVTISMDSLDNK